MKIIKLPKKLSKKEDGFIEKFYPFHKLPLLENANGKKCTVIRNNFPIDGCSLVKCKCVRVIDGSGTEKLISGKLFILNEWII